MVLPPVFGTHKLFFPGLFWLLSPAPLPPATTSLPPFSPLQMEYSWLNAQVGAAADVYVGSAHQPPFLLPSPIFSLFILSPL